LLLEQGSSGKCYVNIGEKTCETELRAGICAEIEPSGAPGYFEASEENLTSGMSGVPGYLEASEENLTSGMSGAPGSCEVSERNLASGMSGAPGSSEASERNLASELTRKQHDT